MARSKHKPKPSRPAAEAAPLHKLILFTRILATLLLAASSAALTQLSLSPIYGSIPSARAKSLSFPLPWPGGKVQIALPGLWVMPLAFFVRMYVSKRRQGRLSGLLSVLGVLMPVLLAEMGRFSSGLGAEWGPVFVGGCAVGPLFLGSLVSVLGYDEGFVQKGPGSKGVWSWDLPLIVGCYAILDKMQDVLGGALASNIARWSGVSPFFSRFGLLAAVSTGYALLERPRKRLAALGGIALLHLLLLNPHLPFAYNTSLLNVTLQSEGYSLVARQESLTGYISVLDNTKDHFRVMRCDHSLLGGEWTNKPAGHPAVLNEPIYSIFVMLEAVRLVECESFKTVGQIADRVGSALVIGLGVGTAPAALMEHGVEVTTVEIDPVVHDFAVEYFGLSHKHTSIIGDAVEVVKDLEVATRTYDYIIHDVFTGGAEPIELFTQEFLTGLKNLLYKDGVIAINYAGDLLLPSAISVIETVKSVFPICQFFREVPQPLPLREEDYTNIVMFCRMSTEPFTFRDPVEKDFLGSPARRQHLFPRNEVNNTANGKGEILRTAHTAGLKASQMKSAIGHWQVMRTVLPAKVWETW